MKKIILTFLILTSFYAIAKEEAPILLDNASIYVEEVTPNETSLINVDDDMKKAQSINKIKEEMTEVEKAQRKIKLNSSQINHQRALDYTTRRNNSTMLPSF